MFHHRKHVTYRDVQRELLEEVVIVGVAVGKMLCLRSRAGPGKPGLPGAPGTRPSCSWASARHPRQSGVKASLSSEFKARLDSACELTFFGRELLKSSTTTSVEEKPLARGLSASPTASPLV